MQEIPIQSILAPTADTMGRLKNIIVKLAKETIRDELQALQEDKEDLSDAQKAAKKQSVMQQAEAGRAMAVASTSLAHREGDDQPHDQGPGAR